MTVQPEHYLVSDLAMDSVEIWEMIMELEGVFFVEIPDHWVPGIKTVNHVVEIVTELLGERNEAS